MLISRTCHGMDVERCRLIAAVGDRVKTTHIHDSIPGYEIILFCHCEEYSDEAIRLFDGVLRIATVINDLAMTSKRGEFFEKTYNSY